MIKHNSIVRTRFFVAISALFIVVVAMVLLSGCSENRTYTISGAITSGGLPLPGVTVTLSGDVSRVTVTDADGNYKFISVPGGIFQVTPSPTGNSFFRPPYRKVWLQGLDAIGFNFSSSNEGRLAAKMHTVYLKNDGTVWTWGNNSSGQLGIGSTTQSNTPVQVSGLSNIIAVAAGASHTVILKNDGTVWAWGNNSNGQLGNGSTTQSSTPVQVSGLSSVLAVEAGDSHTVILKSDGTVWTWGNNSNGQLGNSSTIQSNTPLQVSGLSNVIAVASGASHTIVLKSDGTVWAWGNNSSGQLGIGSTTQSSTPVQVGSLTNVIAVTAGDTHSVILKNDGANVSVWAWGSNSSGQLGNGGTTQSNAPLQVSGLSSVTSISAGASHTVILKNDGTVWAWGSNSSGQLGNGTTTDVWTPVQSTPL
jgi:alpha-tubulin suppressor-like RCC1 family protein